MTGDQHSPEADRKRIERIVIEAIAAGAECAQVLDGKVEVKSFYCPYCGAVNVTQEAASQHDGECDKHPMAANCAALRQRVAALTAALEYTTAEKHGAQADAERHKNVADGLRQRVAELEKALQWQTFRADDAVKTLDARNDHIAELEQGIASANSVAQIRYEQIIRNNADATQRIAELEATCAGLRETLQPFAEKIPDVVLDHETWKLYRTAGQIRNAAAALIASPAEHRQRIEAPLLERIAELQIQRGFDTGITCCICKTRIYGACIGAGDGTGQEFAHPGCFYHSEERRRACERDSLKASVERSAGQAKEAAKQVERLRDQSAAHIRIRDAEHAMETGRIEAAERRGMKRAAEILRERGYQTAHEPRAICLEMAAAILAEIAKPAPQEPK